MPVYDYGCTKCGRQVEVIHGVSAPGPTSCDVCGGAMHKLLSAPAIVFRGSGWAKKDARTAATSTGSKQADEAPADGKTPTDVAPKKEAAEKNQATTGDAGAKSAPASPTDGA